MPGAPGATLGPPPLVVCGPPGAGKNALIQKLLEVFPDKFGFPASHTGSQTGEKDGRQLHFTDSEATRSRERVEAVRGGGKICILDVGVQGAKGIREKNLWEQARFVLVLPPSVGEMERRLWCEEARPDCQELASPEHPAVGDSVLVGSIPLKGTLRFMGNVEFALGEWMGVELDHPSGKNDGSVQGIVYFSCKPLHGLFVRRETLTLTKEQAFEVRLKNAIGEIQLSKQVDFFDHQFEFHGLDGDRVPAEVLHLFDLLQGWYPALGRLPVFLQILMCFSKEYPHGLLPRPKMAKLLFDLGIEERHITGLLNQTGPAEKIDHQKWLSCIFAEDSTDGVAQPLLQFSIENILDIFSVCSSQVPVLQAALEQHVSLEAQVVAVAEVAVNRAEEVQAVLPHVRHNLMEAAPLPEKIRSCLRQVILQSSAWRHDSTGRVDNPPTIDEAALRSLSLTIEEIATIRNLAFAHMPPAMTAYASVTSLRDRLFRGSTCASLSQHPCAILTVGPPGSGKSHVLIERESGCMAHLQEEYGAPHLEQCVSVNPDFWIENLCRNDNRYRPRANFEVMLSFMCATKQRRHMLFDGTGKDLQNTCGRIISRLKQAKYRILMGIVLASFDTCWQRCERRREKTGRAVPREFVRLVFENLRVSVPVYLRRQAELADAIVIYDNDVDGPSRKAFVVTGGVDAGGAIDFCEGLLSIPPET